MLENGRKIVKKLGTVIFELHNKIAIRIILLVFTLNNGHRAATGVILGQWSMFWLRCGNCMILGAM